MATVEKWHREAAERVVASIYAREYEPDEKICRDMIEFHGPYVAQAIADAEQRGAESAKAESSFNDGVRAAQNLVRSAAKSTWRGGLTERSDALSDMADELSRLLEDASAKAEAQPAGTAVAEVLEVGSAPNGQAEVILTCSPEEARKWAELLYTRVTVRPERDR